MDHSPDGHEFLAYNNRSVMLRARSLYDRSKIGAYRSAAAALVVAIFASVFLIVLFKGLFPYFYCYLANHSDIPVSRSVHCRLRSHTESNMLLLFRALTTMLKAMDVQYFINGDLLLVAVLPEWVSYKHVLHEATLGILPAGLEKLQRLNHSLQSRYHLLVYNSKLHNRGNRDSSVVVRVIDRDTDLYIDIHEFIPTFHLDGITPYVRSVWSQSWHRCQSCDVRLIDDRRQFYIPFNWVLPLVSCQYHGINTTCPAKSLELLHYYYQMPFYKVHLNDSETELTAIR